MRKHTDGDYPEVVDLWDAEDVRPVDAFIARRPADPCIDEDAEEDDQEEEEGGAVCIP